MQLSESGGPRHGSANKGVKKEKPQGQEPAPAPDTTSDAASPPVTWQQAAAAADASTKGQGSLCQGLGGRERVEKAR